MKGVNYDITVSKKFFEETGTITVYGIALRTCDENGTPKTVAAISDISSDSEFVAEIARKLNVFSVSPVHFKDVVCDMVARQIAVSSHS